MLHSDVHSSKQERMYLTFTPKRPVFIHKRAQGDWDWRLRFNDTPNAKANDSFKWLSLRHSHINRISYYLKWLKSLSQYTKWLSQATLIQQLTRQATPTSIDSHIISSDSSQSLNTPNDSLKWVSLSHSHIKYSLLAHQVILHQLILTLSQVTQGVQVTKWLS